MANIFKAYDIRGVYPSEINEDVAYKIGRAFVVFLGCKEVVVGRDMRKSSPSLFKALTDGITDQGANVIDIGMVATPMLSFSVSNYGYEAGIMISASHNPAKYNAFKLIKSPALQLHSGNGIEEIKQLVEKNEFGDEEKGTISQRDVLNDYLEHVRRFCSDVKDLKVVFDYGNGVGSVSGVPLVDSLPITAEHMYDQPDDSFPHHEANPHDIDNFKDLQKRVVEENADLGVFYDGDADRSTMVDEKGNIVFPDVLLGILSKFALEGNSGEKVYFDLRFSKAVTEEIKKNGGVPVMMRVGNPFYKEKLIKEGGVLAGEFSGHVMFKVNHCIDDGLFCAVKCMSAMCKTGKKLSELAAPLDKYYHTEEINTKVKDADETMKFVESHFEGGERNDIDGVYISYDDWWFSLRKSNTEPLVRLRVEANTPEKRDEMRKKIVDLIEQTK